MSTMRNLLGLALLMSAGCYQESAYAQGAPTVGTQPSWQGPPGGDMDPQYGAQPYQAPQQPMDPAMDPATAQNEAVDPNAAQEPAAEDPGYGTQAIDDGQIDATLDAHGTWQEDEDYGRIWVPNATEVGVDFTPYETGGSWVYSDSGYMFDCADYSWGWLPFHYGRWGWFDGYWGWVPGYNWGPAWVDWRYGGGYVGWRPLAPEWRTGEHWNVRDHRHQAQVMDSHWRFANEGEMTKGPIRGHLYKNPSEGLRATQPMRPPRPAGVAPVHSASIMRARMPASFAHPAANGPRGPFNAQHPGVASQPSYRAPQYRQPAFQQPYRAPQAYRQPYQPTYRAPQAYRQPAYQQPYRQPAYQQPYRAPQSTYRPPQSTYRPPAPTYRAPAPAYRPQYSAPSHSYSAPSYSAPSHSYSAPSHSAPSYSAPSHSYSAPSHSSGGGGGGHSSGGGGHHR